MYSQVTIVNWFGAIVLDIWLYILGQRDRLLVSTVIQNRECIEHSMQFSEKLGELHPLM